MNKLIVGCAFWMATGLGAQERPVTLEDAIAEARRSSPDVLAAEARADAAAHGRRAAASFLMPSLAIEAGAVRSDDPVAAFGSRLRQGRFTQADFDPMRLNHPDPVTDWSGAIGAAWAPLDPAAAAGLQAADADEQAARLGADWARLAAGFRAEVRYLQAVGAQRRLAAATVAVEAAEANARLVALRAGEGMLTDADLLQARAALEAARAASIEIRRGVDDARERLAVAMGWDSGPIPLPVDTVFGGPGLPEGMGLTGRPDLEASQQSVAAAAARAKGADRARLPRLEAFARLATHSSEVVSGMEEDWTVGFQVRVPVFTGFALTAGRKAAASLRDAAARDHDSRVRQAEAELADARRAVVSARQAAAAAEAARDAATEASRLMRRRFEEGLATASELLGAEARSAELSSGAVDASLRQHLAGARLAFLTQSNQQDIPGGMDR